ncbi:hypothetical protein CVT24_011878 [Panaeolus cyanescens]|uniref:Uncharacterized protein n=1 Tax=Panaeolus cyanescens TaxID=181874 RepID=A0A409YNN9_9AGAR|nr:hypothetical protein CVT24_011878 [Panaeolus cyanescens]
MDFRTGLQLLSPYSSILQNNVNLDVSGIKGNASDDIKRLSISLFRYFINDEDHSYGASIGKRLRPLEMNVFEDSQNNVLVAETIFEIDVESALG